MLLAAGLNTGCLERKEKVTVQKNGAVEIAIAYKGDPADFEGRDPMPGPASGWSVEDQFETKDNGDSEQLRTATRRFGPGEPLPESFASPGSPEAEIALAFPTSIEIERRPDGVYYHFRRVYPARDHARFNYHKEQASRRYGKIEDIVGDREFADLTGEEQGKVLSSLRFVELHRQLDDAYDAVADLPWPQDVVLMIDGELHRYFEQTSVQPLVAALAEEPGPQRDDRINAIAEDFIVGVREHIAHRLAGRKLPPSEIEAFFDVFETASARRAISEDLADEKWRIELSLPGELVAHNGDTLENGSVVWEFDSEAFFDRDMKLMATSRIARNRSEPERTEQAP
jgi:hypothetical protein